MIAMPCSVPFWMKSSTAGMVENVTFISPDSSPVTEVTQRGMHDQNNLAAQETGAMRRPALSFPHATGRRNEL